MMAVNEIQKNDARQDYEVAADLPPAERMTIELECLEKLREER